MSEVWLLDKDYMGEKVQIVSSGMTVLTSEKGGISVGYSADDRLKRFRLISASPELLNIVNEAKKLINSDSVKEWQRKNFNKSVKLVENKINGDGEIKAPNHCRANYEWTDTHIKKYHNKVKDLKYKL